MGAWGHKSFENDAACDWLYDLEKVSDLSLIESTLGRSEAEYLEAPEGCEILAAAEIVLALQGQARASLSEEALKWITKHKILVPSSLNAKTVAAVERVLAENSELRELWEESEEDFEIWRKDVLSLLAAL